jgi:chromosome segregation ATPase
MTYSSVLEDLPKELQLPMLRALEAVEARMRSELAVRREDFDALRATVGDLATAQQRTEQRLEELAAAQQRTEQRVEELAAAQQRTEQRLEELAAAQQRTEQRLEELAAAQQRTEQRLEELATAQQRTEQRLEELIETTNRHERVLFNVSLRVDQMRGDFLEMRYREKAFGYFGGLLRRAQAVSLVEIEDQLEEQLTPQELEDLRRADVTIRGRARQAANSPEVWLVVEVSSVIDQNDVQRARQRAAFLQKAGYRAVPVVAGESSTLDAQTHAEQQQVAVLENGKARFWEAALNRALSAA